MTYIILKHPIHTNITDAECLDAIPERFKQGDPVIVEVKPASIPFGEPIEDWDQLALMQKKAFETVKPLLDQHGDAPIFYFGFAPVPLIIHLGYLIGNWRQVIPMFHHHDHKKWYYEFETTDPQELLVKGLPEDENTLNMDVSLNISISGKVNADDTKSIVGDSLMKTIAVELEKPGYDILSKQSDVTAFATEIDKVFQRILEKFPRVHIVHVFGSLPIEAAFIFGTKIQPNIYPKIQTYQYKHTSASKYQPAILLNETIQPQVTFSKESEALADSFRNEWNSILKVTFKKFIDSLSEKQAVHWYNYLGSKENWNSFDVPYWNRLEPLVQNQLLPKDSLSLTQKIVADGFDYDQTKYEWSIDTGFYIALHERLKDKDIINRAGRLFLLHESLHYSYHGVNKQIAADIGSFPKVVEEADYQADVYALLHEYALSKLPSGDFDESRPKEWFINVINIMAETMWSFDDRGETIKEIQIRRMNRYLIWYWQSIRIKYANSLTEILDILSEKPVIEFSGLRVKASNQRVFYNLDDMVKELCELGVYANGKVVRATPANYTELIEGFRERDGNKIKETLEMFYKIAYQTR
ncbi:MAG: SAVED domain-containing protein [Bacteroidetes bacterium]|nr:SAVED domain-containing protein [Bacteroidota bacterium]